MFEKASKLKLRFTSDRGLLTTEDLWDMNLSQLNIIAKGLNKEIAKASEEDFLEEESKEDIKLKLMFDVVLYVLHVKKDEAKARKDLMEKKVKRDKILEILAKKQDANLENMSEDDLLKQLDDLSR